eukprot:scaffold1014_cov260-Pinguiococcus_pyrenoidosus.AAC.3
MESCKHRCAPFFLLTDVAKYTAISGDDSHRPVAVEACQSPHHGAAADKRTEQAASGPGQG